MMKVTVKNTGTDAIDVPIEALISGGQPLSALLAAGAEVEVMFRAPPRNDEVVRSVSAWADSAGYSVSLSFDPCVIVQAPAPQPPAPPSPADPLGLGDG